jgi:hypothetical protein
MNRSCVSKVAVLLFALFAVGETAAAQRVTLSIKDADVGRVLAELSRQSGIDIQYILPREGVEKRHSFTWKETPLKEALRQVGAAFGYTFQRNSPTSFWGQPGAPPPERRRPGVKIDNVQLYVDRLTVSEMRSLNFTTGDLGGHQSFTIELVAEGATEEDVDAIYAFDTGVEAMDDRGNRLVSEVKSFNTGPGSRYPNPDQWRQYLTLPAPDPRARKLTYLTGEVVLYRQIRPVRVEFPLPLAERPVTRTVGDLQLTVTDASLRDGDAVCRLSLSWPGAVGTPGGEQQRQVRPMLVTTSGRRLRPSHVAATDRTATSGQLRSDQTLTFTGLDTPAKSLIFDLSIKSSPDRRIRYRISDIPLPPALGAERRTTNDQRPTTNDRRPTTAGRPPSTVHGSRSTIRQAPSTKHQAPGTRAQPAKNAATSSVIEVGTTAPFYDARGGTMLVRAPGAPRGARLSLGLSRRDGATPGAWRWTDLVLAADGTVRLGPLRPGAYRVRYSLSGPDGAALSSNTMELAVQIVAAREATVTLRRER